MGWAGVVEELRKGVLSVVASVRDGGTIFEYSVIFSVSWSISVFDRLPVC